MGYQYENGVDKVGNWTKQLPDQTEEINEHHLYEFFRVMYERQEIWYKRFILKQPKPWTNDPYLRDYKFTNVYRELDRASQWLIKNVLLDHSLTVQDLIFRILIFRFYNQPNTFDHPTYFVELPYYDNFDAQKIWCETVTYRKMVDNPWHTAYLMNLVFLKKPKDWDANEYEGLFKDYAYCKYAFKKVHESIGDIVTQLSIMYFKPEDLIKVFETLPAVSTFQSHEFYIDFCYVAKYWKAPIMAAYTENDYTNVGPGASLGLRLIFPSLQPGEQKSGIHTLRDIAQKQLAQFGDFKYPMWNKKKRCYDVITGGDYCNISLHQIEMWLCEYSKYWKMSIREGKQRSKFMSTTNHL